MTKLEVHNQAFLLTLQKENTINTKPSQDKNCDCGTSTQKSHNSRRPTQSVIHVAMFNPCACFYIAKIGKQVSISPCPNKITPNRDGNCRTNNNNSVHFLSFLFWIHSITLSFRMQYSSQNYHIRANFLSTCNRRNFARLRRKRALANSSALFTTSWKFLLAKLRFCLHLERGLSLRWLWKWRR